MNHVNLWQSWQNFSIPCIVPVLLSDRFENAHWCLIRTPSRTQPIHSKRISICISLTFVMNILYQSKTKKKEGKNRTFATNLLYHQIKVIKSRSPPTLSTEPTNSFAPSNNEMRRHQPLRVRLVHLSGMEFMWKKNLIPPHSKLNFVCWKWNTKWKKFH